MSTPVSEILNDENDKKWSVPLHIVVIVFLTLIVSKLWLEILNSLIDTYVKNKIHLLLISIVLTVVLILLIREYDVITV